ncbi:hypothetical protein PFISCL1PPCAC_26395, partial [Pristionchus fissidentatus]
SVSEFVSCDDSETSVVHGSRVVEVVEGCVQNSSRESDRVHLGLVPRVGDGGGAREVGSVDGFISDERRESFVELEGLQGVKLRVVVVRRLGGESLTTSFHTPHSSRSAACRREPSRGKRC